MSACHGRRRRRCAQRRDAVPADRRRISARTRSRCSALVLLGVILLLALFAPLSVAAEPLRPRAARRDGQPAAARDRSRPTGGTFWLGTDDQGRDMLSAILYGLRISLGVGVAATVLALRDRSRDRPAGRLFRRADRDADHADRRHPAVVSGDPDRADPDRRAGAGHRQGHRRAGDRAVGVLRAHRARRGAGGAAQGIHRGGALPRAAAGADRVPPPAAELPAADDRRRHGAGGGGDHAGGDAVVPRPRPADHRAVARPADRQRLPVPALRQVLDQLLSRASRCC